MSSRSNSNNHKHVNDYLDGVNSKFKLGITSEHTFRKDLEVLINNLSPNVNVTNEPSKVTDCGNPDFLISKKHIPIGFIEAKDIGKNLSAKQFDEQFNRYKAALDNLVITDYLHFQFFVSGELVSEIKIGEVSGKSIKKIEDNFERFAELLKDFCLFVGQTIKSAQKLATLMAGKARLLENTLYNAVTSDENNDSNTDLREQYETFKSVLIHDLTPSDFADIYAQTLAYGMFAARLHDDTLDTFSRHEAAERIPRTNPFLRRLFDYVAGANIDDRIKPTVDNLAEVFRATDVAEMLKNFGKTTQTQDPIIHFYETFLAEYNPKLRKQRGVWYTPEPVVQFIVRAVDDILKSEFGLADGIADTSKVEIEKQTQIRDSRTKSGFKTIKELVHKVQILDPATGTSTFLAAIIQHVFHSQFENMGGIWSSYVEEDLLPRLHGFELLMASYAMAHLKLDMLLTETGYKPINPRRLQVYLTNSLEEHHPDTGTLFAGWLSAEANEANAIKRDAPVMVVLGNPPYAVSSTNKGAWIKNLIADYKKDLAEKKINLDDDYIKFIRYGQHYIEKNGEGILAFITNNSFIDGVTHRQMRKSLLQTFDKIYILDLHGSSMKNETALDGSKDENVFDIMQGVSINIFVKTKNNKQSHALGQVYHYDLLGLRTAKYEFLNTHDFYNVEWKNLNYTEPYYFFIDKNYDLYEKYEVGFSLTEMFKLSNSGIKTDRDSLFINYTKDEASKKFSKLLTGDFDDSFAKEFRVKDSGSYKITERIKNKEFDETKIIKVLYRPFDERFVYYDPEVISRPAKKVTEHILKGSLGLVTCRQQSTFDFQHILVSKLITEVCTVSLQTKETGYNFPLYLYPNTENNDDERLLDHDTKDTISRLPNLNLEIVSDISERIGLKFTYEKTNEPKTFAPIDILDYIYGVLHSPTYREVYKEFLKIDFPRIPYPKDVEQFWQLVELGGQLRQIHLLESPKLAEKAKALGISYPKSGNNKVTRKMTKSSMGFEPNEGSSTTGKVWINDEQYFDNIPLVAWEFYIGGYQPAQKWLKDRNGRTLNMSDIKHYMNVIAALSLTDELMQKIDEINIVN